MIKIKLFTFIIVCFLCGPVVAGKTHEQQDYFALLSELLNINNDRYQYKDSSGQIKNDSLRQFKEIERIYINHINPDLDKDHFSEKRLKIVMFFSFYAQQRNSAAINEYLATDLIPIYTQNRSLFLKILHELTFLIPSNCNRLNAYFGFDGKNMNEKQEFIKENEKTIKSILTKNDANLCLYEFSN